MNISNFDELLLAAAEQPEPQRLLFVFANAGLPDDASAGQRARFEAGEGGNLTPVMCADKQPAELASFQALIEESRHFERPWDIVFVAAMSDVTGRSPDNAEIDVHLQHMVEAIKTGRIGALIPFDKLGRTVQFC